MKATKKPVEIDFYPCERVYFDDIIDWSTKERPILADHENGEVLISTLEGTMKATIKDMVIKGVGGEVYPIKRKIFEKTYVY